MAGLLWLVSVTPCTGQDPPAYCSETRTCAGDRVCNLPTFTCVQSRDAGTPDSTMDEGPGQDKAGPDETPYGDGRNET